MAEKTKHPVVKTWVHVPVNSKEADAINALVLKQDISPVGVMKQALRLYQAVSEGAAVVTFPRDEKKGCGTDV